MITDNESKMDKLFLSYKKILYRFQILDIRTKSNKNVTYSDLAQACEIMHKKHHLCRWRFMREKNNQYYVLIEGYYWLQYVYFQNNKKMIDADIDFFLLRIKQYEELLHITSKELWNKDMYISELANYFNRCPGTIYNSLSKMYKANNETYKYTKGNKYVISKLGIEWLCKNCFKHKYLELLETYKMELTEKYMEAGHPYDNF